MPEGDTIHRAATRLKSVLEGQIVEGAASRWLGAEADSLGGCRIEEVSARGKHLLIGFDDGRVLHSHMGMTGSWHIYRRGEPWQKPAHRAAISLAGMRVVAVCFTPKVLELLTAAGVKRHAYLNRLGPDLLGNQARDEDVLLRFRQCNNLPIGEAVLNQTVVSGIGNVYKSEVLFEMRMHPRVLVGDLSDEQILTVAAKARELMAKNLDGRPRTTRFALGGGRFWVYGRSGRSCYRCGTPIELIRQGDAGRTTYFCRQCQPELLKR